MAHSDQSPAEGDVYVNDSCIGCSACVAICGHIFDLDDQGLAFVKESFKQNSDIDDAISACPVEAIHYK